MPASDDLHSFSSSFRQPTSEAFSLLAMDQFT